MPGEAVPDFNHVARYCGGSSVAPDGRITAAAFSLRRKDGAHDDSLSVNWLEKLHPSDRGQQIATLRVDLLKQGIKRLGATAMLAVLRAGKTVQWVSEASPERRILRVTHEPVDGSPSHSLIHGYTFEEDIIAQLIADTVLEQYPAKA